MIRLTLKVVKTFCSMFLVGEKFADIKSMCFVDYANYLYEVKNFEQAVNVYSRAISFNSKNYFAYAGLAASLLEQKMFQEAQEYCEKAASIKADIYVNIMLYVIYDSIGKTHSANTVLQKILKYFRNNPAAAYDRLSYTYFRLGLYQKAEYYINEAVKILPNEAGIHYNAANIYLAQQKFQEAKKEFKEVLEFTTDKRYKKYAARKIENINNRLHPS